MWRISAVRVDETGVGSRRKRGTRFKDNLEVRVAENIDDDHTGTSVVRTPHL